MINGDSSPKFKGAVTSVVAAMVDAGTNYSWEANKSQNLIDQLNIAIDDVMSFDGTLTDEEKDSLLVVLQEKKKDICMGAYKEKHIADGAIPQDT